MVLSQETRHKYPFHWDVVTRAFWNKYPNPMLSHVERVDVLDRRIDAQGNLRTLRLAKCSQANLPSYVKSLVGPCSYVFEETICDPVNKKLVLKSTNLSFRSIATVEEECVYTVSKENPEETDYCATVQVSAFVPMLSTKMESFSIRRGAETASKGIRAIEGICDDIFNGTFVPSFSPAFCESPASAAPVTATTTTRTAAASTATATAPTTAAV